jgi:hypothetical protein
MREDAKVYAGVVSSVPVWQSVEVDRYDGFRATSQVRGAVWSW